MEIQVLNNELVSQIAAGEVIERPASVVKELVENAIDAGAGKITIRVEGHGLRLIEVADDGEGIRFEELELAVTRHATSKLASLEDLYQIHSLGFRGEALASIASVARLQLISRNAQAETGGEIQVDGGKVTALRPVGVPQGTVARVANLFFNVPPRMAFLKSPTTEKSRINDLVFRYGLAYPSVRWQLFQDNKPVLQTSGRGDRREILAELYGVAVSHDLIEVSFQENDYQISGYISPAQITRSNRREITFFVNGRWVLDGGLTAALMQAYGHLLPPQRYPLAVLFINMDPLAVDVNVHPAKAEVRFRDSGQVFITVQRAIRRAFMAFSPVGDANQTSVLHGGRTPGTSAGITNTIDPAWTLARLMRDETNQTLTGTEPARTVDPATGEVSFIADGMDLLRYIGKMRDRYILAEGPDGLYLIDGCAAWERILYERLLQYYDEKRDQTAERAATFDIANFEGFDEWLPVFKRLDIHMETFGPTTIRVRRTPDILTIEDVQLVMTQVMQELPGASRLLTVEEKMEWLLARIVYWAGSRYGTDENMPSPADLLSQLQVCRSPRITPSGKATMIHLSLDLLTRQFDH